MAMPLAVRRADEQYTRAHNALGVARQRYESSSSPPQFESELAEKVLVYLSSTQQRIVRYQEYLRQQAHHAEMLEEGEVRELSRMLAEIAEEFFPGPTTTLVDRRNSLVTRVTQLDKKCPELIKFRSVLVKARREVSILLRWHEWYRAEKPSDANGMFGAIRRRHDAPEIFADCLDDIARAFADLYKLVPRGGN